MFGLNRINIDNLGLTPTMELYPTFAIVLLIAVIKTNLDHMATGMQKFFSLCHTVKKRRYIEFRGNISLISQLLLR